LSISAIYYSYTFLTCFGGNFNPCDSGPFLGGSAHHL
jgi:hypothetical protein